MSDISIDHIKAERLNWFQDMKLGLFMHWGAYSVWGSVESWPVVEDHAFGRDELKAWEDCGKDPDKFREMYFNLNKEFNPTKFDPKPWAEAAVNAGMKYVVFTTRHCDGFSMYDTKVDEYGVTHAPCPFSSDPRADTTKEVFDAFRERGIAIGVYYSLANWHHPDYWDPNEPHKDPQANYDIKAHPEKWQRYVKYVHDQIGELMTGYGKIDILWLDCGWVKAPNEDILMDELADRSRAQQPGLIVVDRCAGTRNEDYLTPEQEIPDAPLDKPWESCITMGDQWSYKFNDNVKPTRELIRMLVEIVSKGGNLLLDTGPSPEGELDPVAVTRMEEIGDWMKVNSEAIYGTRAVAPYQERSIRFTKNEDNIYAIYLSEEEQETPPAQVSIQSFTPKPGSQARMLGSDEPLNWRIDNDTTLIELSEAIQQSPPCTHAWILKFQID